MVVQIGAQLDSGFDDPIGMLKDCHRRIEQFLRVLVVAAERAQGRELTEEEGAAVQSALDYFRGGGLRHTADEEDSLFPRLREQAEIVELGSLESEHQAAGHLHEVIEGLYVAWMKMGRLERDEGQRLLRVTRQLAELYEAHIRVEEEIVFPRARTVFDSDTVAAMGREFKARRT